MKALGKVLIIVSVLSWSIPARAGLDEVGTVGFVTALLSLKVALACARESLEEQNCHVNLAPQNNANSVARACRLDTGEMLQQLTLDCH